MDIRPLDITTPDLLPPNMLPAMFTRLGAGGEDFAHQLEAAARDPDQDQQARLDTLRKSSEQLVAITFIMPMLAQIREDPFKSDLFHGGQTEEFFGQRLDTIMAERIVAKADFSIVDAVFNSIAKRASMSAGEAQGPADEAKGVDTHG